MTKIFYKGWHKNPLYWVVLVFFTLVLVGAVLLVIWAVGQMDAIGKMPEATTPPPIVEKTQEIVQATLEVTPGPLPSPTVSSPTVVETITSGDWQIEYFAGATDQMKGWTWQKLDPANWPVDPQNNNPLVGFTSDKGWEWGMQESSFCQYQETCDIVVPAEHYRIITGDYDIEGIGSCTGSEGGVGCALMIINVGGVNASYEDAHVDSGYTHFGRYFNGDFLNVTIWGGLSYTSNVMLNLNSILNPIGIQNAGGNCSVPTGCKGVNNTFTIISGNELLVKGVATVNR